jgi:hypothetical protein
MIHEKGGSSLSRPSKSQSKQQVEGKSKHSGKGKTDGEGKQPGGNDMPPTPQRTVEKRRLAPTPIIAVLIV